ncbi:MAG: hypothetical protein PHC94_06750 [Methylobacter sp.]|nr:hypothetical protein [Methylobacter sp.]
MISIRSMTPSKMIAMLMLLLVLPVTLSAATNDPSINYQYDATGNLTQYSDGLGRVTVQHFDALNRLVSQLQPNPTGNGTLGEIQYQYDAQDNAVQITDPKGLSTYNTIDGLNNLNQQDSPDTGTSLYSYDPAGNLVGKTDASGVVASYRYDAGNRLTQIQHARTGSTTETVALQYDQGANGLDRLTGMTPNYTGGIMIWSYDRQGRIIGQQQSTGALNFNQQTQYDNAGRPQTLVYPSGHVIEFVYNALGRVSQINVDGVPAVTGITWQPFGGVQSWTWAGSGNAYARSYDLSGRITSTTLGDSTRNLEWDAANRIMQSVDAPIASPATAANLQSYAYDNLDHLTQYLSANTLQNYSYDLDGNRTQRIKDGNAVDYNYAANNNQLLAASIKNYSYDAAGRVISDGVNQYSYNNSGRLTQVINSQGRTWYYYNGLGRRVGKWSSNPLDLAGDADHDGKITIADYRKTTVMVKGLIPIDLAADCDRDNAVTLADVNCVKVKYGSVDQYQLAFTHFVYDEVGHLIGEYRQIGTPIQETVYLGDTPVLILMPGATPQIYTIDTDHLNTPRVIKNTAGAIVWRWDQSEPFGNTQANSNPSGLGAFTYNLRFPGQYYDRETGLHYNMERYYDPDSGRYRQSDPIGLAGGINTYAYVSNNPLRYVDPLGLVTTLFTTYDSNVGTHSALLVETPGQSPILYDPAGSYMEAQGTRPTGGYFDGADASFSQYYNYQISTGSAVDVVTIPTTPAQEKQIIKNIEQIGDPRGFSCAASVSAAIDGACGIEGSNLPGLLRRQADAASCPK